MSPPKDHPVKRFTISLPEDAYERLRELAEGRQPPLSLRYVVEYAVRELIGRADDGQLPLDFGNPVASRKAER